MGGAMMTEECSVCGHKERWHHIGYQKNTCVGDEGEPLATHAVSGIGDVTRGLWIPGPLPGMNEIVAAAKAGRGKGNGYARLKARWTNTVALLARAAKLGGKQRSNLRFEKIKGIGGFRERFEVMAPVPFFATGVRFEFRWHEKNRKRDPDNVAAGGRKVVLDGLVLAGTIANDGWGEVASWTDSFECGDKAGVIVTMTGQLTETKGPR